MRNGKNLLRAHELQALLDAVDRLYVPQTPAEFPAHLFAILGDLLPGTLNTFDFVELSSGEVQSHVTPELSGSLSRVELEEIVRKFLWQNPVVNHLASECATAVVQPTDFVSQREFRHTDLYQLGMRPLGIEYQIAAGLAWPGHIGGFAVNRPDGRNFTGREIELVRRLRPHVERAFNQALQIADLHRKAAGRPPPPELNPASFLLSGLTSREAEVLRWVAEGKRNGEIAMILGIASRTVHKHVEHLLMKLEVETRTAAAALVHGAAATSKLGWMVAPEKDGRSGDKTHRHVGALRPAGDFLQTPVHRAQVLV